MNQEYLSRLPAISTTVELSECIPAASYDSWHHYQWVGTYEDVIPAWVAKEPTTRYVMYSQKAYSKFKNELSVFLSGNPTTAGVEQWLESKKEANSKRGKHITCCFVLVCLHQRPNTRVAKYSDLCQVGNTNQI